MLRRVLLKIVSGARGGYAAVFLWLFLWAAQIASRTRDGARMPKDVTSLPPLKAIGAPGWF